VLALARGGVPVGWEVAAALATPLDVFLVRKLGVPRQPELAMGAVASGGAVVLNDRVVRDLGIAEHEVDEVLAREWRELRRREFAYRGGRPSADVTARTVIIVDDGIATGASMRVALRAVRAASPREVIVAVPVGPPRVAAELPWADRVVCASTPDRFEAVGQVFTDFHQVSDDEVCALLRTPTVDERRG
jgi:predicted phosphoribosyltransferase